MRLAATFPILFIGNLIASTLVACNGDTDDVPTTPDLGPFVIEDRILQDLTTPVDVLWVVDGGFRAAIDSFDEGLLVNAHETLLLADPDWRQGILDATASGSKFGLIGLKWGTYPYPPTIFRQPTPQGPPRFRESVYTALELRKEASANKDFIRSTAHLYVIVLTDREDESDDGVITRSAFANWFEGFQPSETKRLSAFTSGNVANYWENRLLGGGTVFEAGSFRKGMEELLLDAIGQERTFVLSEVPTVPPEFVQVWFREHKTEYVLLQDYTYNQEENSITFIGDPPRPNSEVVITYETAALAGPPTTTTTSAESSR